MVEQTRVQVLTFGELKPDCGCGCGGERCGTPRQDCGCGCLGGLCRTAQQELVLVDSKQVAEMRQRAANR